MKFKQFEPLVLKLLLIDCGVILFTQMMPLDWLSSVLFYLLFPMVLFLWLNSLPKKWGLIDVLTVLACTLACGFTLMNWAEMNGPLSFSYFKKVIFFVSALLFLQYCSHRTLSDEETDWIYRWSTAVTWMFPIVYLLQGTGRYLVGDKVSRYLVLGFSNSNLLSLFLTCFIVIECTGFFRENLRSTWKQRAFRVICLLYFVYETQARNAELVLIGYALCFGLLYVSQKKSFSMNKWVAVLVSVFPILFAGAYMFLIENPLIQGMFGFLAGIGKKLSSRLEMWSRAWRYVNGYPLTGAYYQITSGTGSAQMHNTHLDTASSYGLIVMGLLCVIFVLLLLKHKDMKDKRRFCCVMSFGAVILLGMGETALLMGSLGMFVVMGIPLLLANAEMNEADLNAQGESASELKNRIQSSDLYLKALECVRFVQIQLKRIKVKK